MNKEIKGILSRVFLLAVAITLSSHANPLHASNFFEALLQDVAKGASSSHQKYRYGATPEAKEVDRIPEERSATPSNDGSKIGFNPKAANIRSGPGTSNSKVGLLPANSQLTILSEQGNWYKIRANKNGSTINGWIYSPLVTIASNVQNPEVESSDDLSYDGYSKEYLPIKAQLRKGNVKGVEQAYLDKESKVKQTSRSEFDFIQGMGLLHWWERGITSIDLGEDDQAIEYLGFSERILDERQRGSKVGGWFKTALNFSAETLSGNEELSSYSGEGYERVLMLNYKSIAYLLQGNRRAYNVTRRAIDWQNMERKQFEAEREEIDKKLEEKQAEQKKSGGTAKNNATVNNIMSRYAALRVKAKTVPSAFVNPFGYYVVGMIQEYESYDDWSLRDNARISYNKALELNPKSKVLKKAVKDMKKSAPTGSRLVHVVVADGFVPEKKVLTYKISVPASQGGNTHIPVKLPIYDPVESQVSRIEVQTTSGKRLAVLSPVADVEALCLRQQKDMEPVLEMRAMLATTKSVVLHGVASSNQNGIAGALLKVVATAMDETAAPDMRSWMSLPSTIQAARLRLRKGVSKLKIVTYDKRGRVLASKKVSINKNSHDFVYARSMDKTLITQSAKKMWMLAAN